MKVFLFFIFTFTSLISIASAQLSNNANVRPQSGRVIVPDSVVSQRFKWLGITEKNLGELKTIGVDLRYHLTRSHSPDERVDAAMMPIVFVGKVLSIKNFLYTISSLSHRTHPFLSEINVRIIDLLKGPKQLGNNISLLRQSGLAIYKGKKGKVRVSTDPNFVVGDTSVYYLDEIDQDPYLTTVYKSYFSKRKTIHAKPEYWVREENKHNIHNSIVNYYGYHIPLDSFITEITKVNEILGKK